MGILHLFHTFLTDIQEQMKSGASESSALIAEVSQLKEELRKVSTKLEQSTEQVLSSPQCLETCILCKFVLRNK